MARSDACLGARERGREGVRKGLAGASLQATLTGGVASETWGCDPIGFNEARRTTPAPHTKCSCTSHSSLNRGRKGIPVPAQCHLPSPHQLLSAKETTEISPCPFREHRDLFSTATPPLPSPIWASLSHPFPGSRFFFFFNHLLIF